MHGCRTAQALAGGLIAIAVLLASWPADAQTVRAARGVSAPGATPPVRQPHNSMARDTTPFNCEQYRGHPHPGMVGFCQGIENMTLQNEARRQGRPAPSSSVIQLPGMGSPEAKALGYACIGGQAFRRLANGWEQVAAAGGSWQRCQGG